MRPTVVAGVALALAAATLPLLAMISIVFGLGVWKAVELIF